MKTSEIAAILSACSTLITAITALFVVLRATKKIDQVHDEVRTFNGNTIAALADAAEARRIRQDIPFKDQTDDEKHQVAVLTAKEINEQEAPRSS